MLLNGIPGCCSSTCKCYAIARFVTGSGDTCEWYKEVCLGFRDFYGVRGTMKGLLCSSARKVNFLTRIASHRYSDTVWNVDVRKFLRLITAGRGNPLELDFFKEQEHPLPTENSVHTFCLIGSHLVSQGVVPVLSDDSQADDKLLPAGVE